MLVICDAPDEGGTWMDGGGVFMARDQALLANTLYPVYMFIITCLRKREEFKYKTWSKPNIESATSFLKRPPKKITKIPITA